MYKLKEVNKIPFDGLVKITLMQKNVVIEYDNGELVIECTYEFEAENLFDKLKGVKK